MSVVSSSDKSDPDLTKMPTRPVRGVNQEAPAGGGHLLCYARDLGLELVEESR